MESDFSSGEESESSHSSSRSTSSHSSNISSIIDTYSFDPTKGSSTLDPSLKHVHNLSSKLKQFRLEGILCDVKLNVGNQTFYAHKAVLCAVSDYFLAMFTTGFQESYKEEICMEGDGNIFAELLDYIYTGTISLTRTQVLGVLQMASYLQLTTLVKNCQQFLIEQVIQPAPDSIDLDELLQIWHVADAHNVHALDRICTKIINGKLCHHAIHSEIFLEHTTYEQIVKCLDTKLLRFTKEEILMLSRESFWYNVMRYQLENFCYNEATLEYMTYYFRDSYKEQALGLYATPNSQQTGSENSAYDEITMYQWNNGCDVTKSSLGHIRCQLSELKYDELHTEEVQLLTNVTQWLTHDWERRHVFAADVLGRIRLGCLPAESCQRILDARILDNQECKAVFDKVLKLRCSQDAFQLKLDYPESFLSRNCVSALVSVGGESSSTYCHCCTHIDTMSESKWKCVYKIDKLPCAGSLQNHAVLNVYGRLFTAGGEMFASGTTLNSFWRYDPEQYAWKRLEPMPYARACHAMVSLKDNIYVIGGASSNGQSRTFSVITQQYNICREKWRLVDSLFENVEFPSAVAFKGKLIVLGQRYIIGGFVECVIQVYDPVRDHWFCQEATTKFQQPVDVNLRETFPTSKLSIQDGECYQIWYKSVKENDHVGEGPFVSHVNKLVCDFDAYIPVVTIGDSEDQSMIQANSIGACSMNRMVYVDVNGTFYKTGIRVKEEPGKEIVSLQKWTNKPWPRYSRTARVILKKI